MAGRLLRAAAIAALALSSCSVMHERMVAIGEVATTAEAASARRLVVRGAVGSIDLAPAPDDRVSVTARVSVRESLQPQFPAAELARDVRVASDGDAIVVESGHLRDDGEARFEVDLVVRAPARLGWRVDAAVGDVAIAADGGDVEAKLAVGDLSLTGRAARVTLAGSTGNVTATLDALAGGRVSSGVGNVRVELRGGGLFEPLELVGGTGNATLVLPAAIDADAQLSAGVGDARIRGFGGAATTSSSGVGGSSRARLGKGGPAVTVKSGVGSVLLEARD